MTESVEYWAKQPATVNGVMGGYGHLDSVDLQGSKQFLGYVERRLRKWKYPQQHRRALDVGGGVGRVAAGLLASQYKSVTLYEPVEALLVQAERVLPGACVRATANEVNIMQNDVDLVWMQWVAMYLNDDDLVAILSRWRTQLQASTGVTAAAKSNAELDACPDAKADAQPNAKPNATPLIIIKDNVAKRAERDEHDGSVIRTEREWLAVFARSKLTVLHAAIQHKWPRHLHDVVMYALSVVD